MVTDVDMRLLQDSVDRSPMWTPPVSEIHRWQNRIGITEVSIAAAGGSYDGAGTRNDAEGLVGMTEGSTQIDQSKPSIARVYDYLLGGKDNYEVDRKIGDFFIEDLPGSVAIAYANRQALIRAVGAISRDGISQFIDIGSGLP